MFSEGAIEVFSEGARVFSGGNSMCFKHIFQGE